MNDTPNTDAVQDNINAIIDEKKVHRRLIISALGAATGLPWNYLDNEIGDILDDGINNHYCDRVIMASCFGRLWANHCVDGDDEMLDCVVIS